MSKMPAPTELIVIGHYSDGSDKKITWRLRGFLQTVGIPESNVMQGCKHLGSFSASTHAGLECIDIGYLGTIDQPSDDELHRRRALLKRCKDAGAVIWPRDETDSSDFGGSNRHSHLVLPNGRRINRLIDSLAMTQVRSYWLGGNGLIGDARDRYPYRPKGHPKFHYRKWWNSQMQEREEHDAQKRIHNAVRNHGALYHKLVQFVVRLQNHKSKVNH